LSKVKGKTNIELFGKERALEIRKKRSKSMKRAYKEGRKLVDSKRVEVREKIVESQKAYFREKMESLWESEEFKRSQSQRVKVYYKDPKNRESQSKRLKQAYTDLSLREKTSDRVTELWLDEEYRKKTIEGNKKRWTKEERKKQKEKSRLLWENSDYREKTIKGSASSNATSKPNKPEMVFMEFIKKYRFPYKYVGNLKFWIGSKNPDFVHNNGKKKVIEVYGDYWHRGEDPQERIDAFEKHGYDCLVIWEHEIYKEKREVINKLEDFTYG